MNKKNKVFQFIQLMILLFIMSCTPKIASVASIEGIWNLRMESDIYPIRPCHDYPDFQFSHPDTQLCVFITACDALYTYKYTLTADSLILKNSDTMYSCSYSLNNDSLILYSLFREEDTLTYIKDTSTHIKSIYDWEE